MPRLIRSFDIVVVDCGEYKAGDPGGAGITAGPDGVPTSACRGYTPHFRPVDIAFANELGYRIKLLGLAPPDRRRDRSAGASVHGADRPRDRKRWMGCATIVVAEGDSSARVLLYRAWRRCGSDGVGAVVAA